MSIETTKPATMNDLIRHLSRALGRATMAVPCDEQVCADLRKAIDMAEEVAENMSAPEMR